MDNRKILIRHAQPGEAALIADLSRSTFYETFAADNSAENMEIFLAEQFTRASLIEEVSFESNTFLLAFFEDRPAGYVKMRNHQNPPGLEGMTALEVARIYVVGEFIGTGVGSSLMEYIIQFANAQRVRAIWLAVWERNVRAIKFYQRWGFTIFDQQVFLLGREMQKDWRMVKML